MSEKNSSEMSFLEHLEELRWHIIRSLAAVLILAVLAFIFKRILFDIIILGPIHPDFFTNRVFCMIAERFNMPAICINQTPLALQNINMSGQFTMHLWIAVIAGIIIAFPYIFWEFWKFIRPALYPEEIKQSRGAIFFASILFSIGILFAYYLICPLSIEFFGNYKVSESVENIINIDSYISIISSIILACGIMFELPMLIFFLSKVGLVTTRFLRKYRRHAIVISLAVSAIITPPDVVSQIMVCIPIIALYEAGIIIAKRIEKKNQST
ncbi:MAG: twin-arginine translocase subunit TatC [Cytophagaceae bacterium]|jgi:sec-independent protein translocase protein TatC|nr:twin-arginine translocase subunit TatC [Cytophagaceae bacterium]